MIVSVCVHWVQIQHINSVWKFVQHMFKGLGYPFVASNQASSLVWSRQLPIHLVPGMKREWSRTVARDAAMQDTPVLVLRGIRKKWAMHLH